MSCRRVYLPLLFAGPRLICFLYVVPNLVIMETNQYQYLAFYIIYMLKQGSRFINKLRIFTAFKFLSTILLYFVVIIIKTCTHSIL